MCSELLQDPDLFPKEELFYLEKEIEGNCVVFFFFSRQRVSSLLIYILLGRVCMAGHSKAFSSRAFFTGELVLKK